MNDMTFNITNGMASPWTNSRIDLLRVLWANGENCKEIAKQLGGGISKNSVIGKARRLGLSERIRALPVTPRKPARARTVTLPKFLDGRFLGIPLTELLVDDCRYPQGDGPFVFCGQPAIDRSSYCRKHHALCYRRTA